VAVVLRHLTVTIDNIGFRISDCTANVPKSRTPFRKQKYRWHTQYANHFPGMADYDEYPPDSLS